MIRASFTARIADAWLQAAEYAASVAAALPAMGQDSARHRWLNEQKRCEQQARLVLELGAQHDLPRAA